MAQILVNEENDLRGNWSNRSSASDAESWICIAHFWCCWHRLTWT